MQLDAEQFDRILAAVVVRGEASYRDDGRAITPAEAELIVGIAQLAMAADGVIDPDEVALFETIAARVYATADLATTPPTLAPLDRAARLDLIETHGAQLRETRVAPLAYALAFAIVVADLNLARAENELLEALRVALGLDEDGADEIATTVVTIATPV